MSRTLRGFWNKKPAPVQQTTPTISQDDHAKMAKVLRQLAELKEDAEREQLTLGGTLTPRRAAVTRELDNKQYGQAETVMDTLRENFDTLVNEKKAWVAKKNDYDGTKSHLETLADWEAPEAPRLYTALLAVQDRVAKEQFPPAGMLLNALKPKVDGLFNVATLRRPAQLSFNSEYAKLKLKLDDPALILPDAVPDQLKTDRKTIEDDHAAVLLKRDGALYADAEGLLPALTIKVDKLIVERGVFDTAKDKFTREHGPLKGRIDAILTMDDDIPDDMRDKKKEVVDLNKTMLEDETALKYPEAQVALDDLKNNKLVPLETFKTRHDIAKPAFVNVWKSLKYQADEIIKYPQDKMPQSLKDLQKNVVDAYQPIFLEMTERKYFEAEAGIAALQNAVNAALTVKRDHDKAMRTYYAALKPLRPRLKAAEQVSAPPPTLQPLITDYTNAKAAMILAQNDRDYALANINRATLDTAITDLLAARKVALLAVLDTATDPAIVADNVKKLAPEEIAELGAKKQAALLKKLRTGTDGNAHVLTVDEKAARNILYDSIPLDPEFLAEDRKKRQQIAKAFQKDKKFQKAQKEWDTMSDEDRKEFLVHAAKVQCKVMGHPEPTMNFVSQRKCTKSTCADKGKKKDSTLLPPCPVCGAPKVGFSYGSCGGKGGKTTSAAVITLNTVAEAKFGDFGEQLDTIMHENAHAYQQYVVYELMAKDPPKIKEDDPLYKQALLFMENELGTGYETDGATYNNQPLERHSWEFGPAIRNALVGPNVKILGEGEVSDAQDVV